MSIRDLHRESVTLTVTQPKLWIAGT